MNTIWIPFLHRVEQPNHTRTVVVVTLAVVLAFWLSERLARVIIKIAQRIAVHGDNTSNEERQILLRRVETYLGVTIAIVRASAIAIIAYLAYRLVEPKANGSVAAIGASAVFIVMAGATLGTLLRDITSGATMIAEHWFNVGDHIRVEPFVDVAGVVERVTLRSTKLRSLNGEIIWLHNQFIHGIKVTPHGVRTIAVDIFSSDATEAAKLVARASFAIPTGPLMLAKPLTIEANEEWAEGLYHLEIVGQTAPGREWLIEKFFVDALKRLDTKQLLLREPLVRNADPEADRNFKRAVRVAKRQAAK
jgi:hypothetical protein